MLGLSIAPGSLPSYLVTFSTILVRGAAAAARRGRRPHRQQEGPAGRLRLGRRGLRGAAVLRAPASNWQIGAIARDRRQPRASAPRMVVNDSILPLISTEDERDRVSSRGWALGLPRRRPAAGDQPRPASLIHDRFGIDRGLRGAAQHALRGGLVGGVHDHPVPRLREPTRRRTSVPERGRADAAAASASSSTTLRDLRDYPMALTFLLAYLFFNDGIQTVIASAVDVRREAARASASTVLIATILLVQFVAFFGALLFGRLAGRYGAKRVILVGLAIWMVDRDRRRCFCPRSSLAPFLAHGASRSASCSAAPRPCPGRYFSPADPPRPGGGVLQPLPRHGPRHVVVRHPGLRPGLPVDRLLPARDLRADRASSSSACCCYAGRHRAGHPRGRERRSPAWSDAPAPGGALARRLAESSAHARYRWSD